jgi:Capsule biosynthesis CapC
MILPIFPEGGLTSSVITTVWVGAFVLTFFNLRFGWVMSGLVVPGYLVPLMIVRPLAAAVITVEAVLTYLIIWVFSEKLSKGRFNGLFGRDRFMALILASIAVRTVCDGWLLPVFADWMAAHWGSQIDWHSNLQSFGLVVISLMANQLWKPGLVRGLLMAAVVTGITCLIVRYGLMEFTNFRLSGVSYIYEGLASSILASPKAYMILVITAFIASQMNLKYGWDFSGILIPALIALQWYQPTKILSSIVEAGVVYILAQLVMKLPFMVGATIEGSRKLLLFFNVSFFYKLVLGHILVWLALDIKTTDFYGFGYLLSTLLAIKAHDKGIFTRLLRSTLEVSLIGAVAGNGVGLLLAYLIPARAMSAGRLDTKGQDVTTEALLVASVGDAHIRSISDESKNVGVNEATELEATLDLLSSGSDPQFISPGLVQSDFMLVEQADGLVALAGKNAVSRDLVLYNPKAKRSLAVIVSNAAQSPGIGAAALAIFRAQNARWLVIAAPPSPSALSSNTVLDIFRRSVSAPELRVGAISADQPQKLRISGNAAVAIDLTSLRSDLPHLITEFTDSSENGNIAQIMLNIEGIDHLAGPRAEEVPDLACALSNTGLAKPIYADMAQLAYLRFEVAEPLLASLKAKQAPSSMNRRTAELGGYSLAPCAIAGQPHWRLASNRFNEGIYLFAANGDQTRLVESAPGLAETVPIAGRWNAGAILIVPTEKTLVGKQRNSFGVISQVAIRAMGAQNGALIQLRNVPQNAPSLPMAADIAIVPDWVGAVGDWNMALQKLAIEAGYKPAVMNRGKGGGGYEVANSSSLRYLAQTSDKRFATFWVLKTAGSNGK